MAYEKEMLDVAESEANRISTIGQPQTVGHTITRGWKGVDEKRKATVEEYLRTVKQVENPMVDSGKAQFTGMYDVVSAGWDAQYQGYVQVLKLRSPWEADVQTVSDNVYETTTEKQLFDQEAPPSLGTFAAGVLKTISAAVDALKKWRVELRTVTSKEVIYSFTFTGATGGLPEYHWVCKNQKTLDVSVVGETPAGYIKDISGAPKKNPDGTWDWYIVIRPDSSSLQVGLESFANRTRYIYRKTKMLTKNGDIYVREDDGKHEVWWQRAEVTESWGYKCFVNVTDAWVYSGFTPPSYAGYGRWIGHYKKETTTEWAWDSLADIVSPS